MRLQRITKIGLGFALLAASGYVLIGEAVTVTSIDAVINARISVVRAPIDGQLALQRRAVGERIRQGEEIGTVTDARADDSRLLDLERGAGVLAAELERLEAQLAANERSQAELKLHAEAYHTGRIKQLEARLNEAKSQLVSAKARSAEAQAALGRAEDLSRRGVQSVATLDQARSSNEVNLSTIQAANSRIQVLTIELETAKEGTFLGDSYNDTPYSVQRGEELSLRHAELTAERTERRQRLSTLNDQIASERRRVIKLREAFLTAPVSGQVWEPILGDGEHVRKGQEILRLLDCSTVIVTASVAESDYNRLSVGDSARFRVSGTNQVVEGSVLRLAGSGAATIYGSLAVAPSAKHLERYDVALAFPGLAATESLACAVGRTGKVVFSGTPIDLWQRLLSWVGLA